MTKSQAELDPDFRRPLPKTAVFCCRCQKDIADSSKALRVYVDWNTFQVTLAKPGEHLVGEQLLGRDCAKRIGLLEKAR